MKERFKDKTLWQLMLLGRVDIKQLSPEERKAYGSNNGLAQARAKWVLEKLTEEFPEYKNAFERSILLSAGPLHVRGEASEMNQAKDRSVEVWACWTPKPKPQSVDSSTDSPETPQESAAK